ncbi:MAG: BrnT family toxin [Candidatus Omnitrophota bacterium]
MLLLWIKNRAVSFGILKRNLPIFISEERFFCIGKVEGKILTVRFIYRGGKIRIFGAGYWRKGERYYEKKDVRPE